MKLRLTLLSLSLVALVLPAAASAAGPSPLAKALARAAAKKKTSGADPVVATFLACGADKVQVGVGPAPGKPGRKARGATITARVEVYPLLGKPVSKPARSVGKTGAEDFSGLAAGGYVGIVKWKLKKGSRVVASGTAHTDTVKVGGRRGVGVCALPVGVPPKDVLAPQVFISPADEGWQRGPLTVRFTATDDFSGVAAVVSSIDGGALAAGNARVIADEGVHTVDYAARDAAGNTSAVKRQTLRVDSNAPTAPVVTAPPAATGDNTPAIVWTPSTDSASGVFAYYVEVRNAADQVVFLQPVGPDTQRIDTGVLPDGAYSARVYAFDGVGFITPSDARAFGIVSAPPTATLASTNPIRVDFDRPMDPSTLAGNITLNRTVAPQPAAPSVSCNSPCTQATVTPAQSLEGTYNVSWGAGVKSEEGTPLTPGSSGAFGVRAYSNDFSGACGFTTAAPWACTGGKLQSTGGMRGLGGATYTATSNSITSLRGGTNSIHVSYRVAFTNASSCTDAGRVLYRFDGSGGFTIAKTYTATQAEAADSIDIPDANHTSLELQFQHQYSGASILPGGCAEGGGLFSIDDIVAQRP